MRQKLGETRTFIRDRHALICPDSHERTTLPNWPGCDIVFVITPQTGARFTEYFVEMRADGFGSRPLLPIFFESVLFPLGALASIGISMLYVSSAQLINNTQVKLSRAQLTIQHGPLPWLGSGSFPTQNIKSLNVQTSRIGHGNGQQMSFKLEVHMTLINGKRKKIIGGFDTLGEAQIVQREIESYLHR